MNLYQKRRIKKLVSFPLGCILAILTIPKPIMILFLIPFAAIFFRRKIKNNKNLILFLIGFLVIYSPFMYTNNISIGEQTLTLYNSLKNEIVDFNLGSINAIDGKEILEDFEEENYFVLETNGESAEAILTDEDSAEGTSSLKLKITTPTKRPIILYKKINPSDWSQYDYFNLWIKNEGEYGWFGIILVDEDGDRWQYDNDQILKKKDWTLLKIPLRALKNYENSNKGNKKMDNIIEYQLKFGEHQKVSNYKGLIDQIYLSRF